MKDIAEDSLAQLLRFEKISIAKDLKKKKASSNHNNLSNFSNSNDDSNKPITSSHADKLHQPNQLNQFDLTGKLNSPIPTGGISKTALATTTAFSNPTDANVFNTKQIPSNIIHSFQFRPKDRRLKLIFKLKSYPPTFSNHAHPISFLTPKSDQKKGLPYILSIDRNSQILIKLLEPNSKKYNIDLLEINIRNMYLTRGDMWHLSSLLVNNCVYKNQPLNNSSLFSSTTNDIIINSIYVNNKKFFSGYVDRNTKIIFRSKSARLTFLIQLSNEMFNFEEDGEIMFHKVINSIFPKILKHWSRLKINHLITIVLFTSVSDSIDYLDSNWNKLTPGQRLSKNLTRDYYRVVVDQINVIHWDKIMYYLRYEFANFAKDILYQHNKNDDKYYIRGKFLPTIKGNLLEAINLSTSLVADYFKDPDFRHTTNHFILITPGSGLFDVDYELFKTTSERMLSLENSFDIICLSQPPLYPTPLFRYSLKNDLIHRIPSWVDTSFWEDQVNSNDNVYNNNLYIWKPRCKIYEIQMMGVMQDDLKNLFIKFSQKQKTNSSNVKSVGSYMENYDNNVFSNDQSSSEDDSSTKGKLSLLHSKYYQPHTSLTNSGSLSSALKHNISKGLPTAEETKFYAKSEIKTQNSRAYPSLKRISLLGLSSSKSTISSTPSNSSFAHSASASVLDINGELDNKSLTRNEILSIKTSFSNNDHPSRSKEHKVSELNIIRSHNRKYNRNINNEEPLTGKKSIKKDLNTVGNFKPKNYVRVTENSNNNFSSFNRKIDFKNGSSNEDYHLGTFIENPSKSIAKPNSTAGIFENGKWSNVFPKSGSQTINKDSIKWKSLSTPAALPLTTSIFPTKDALEFNYTNGSYEVISSKISYSDLMREIIYTRLSLGFQICEGKAVSDFENSNNLLIKYIPDKRSYKTDIIPKSSVIYLSLNDEVHRINAEDFGCVVMIFRKRRSHNESPYSISVYRPYIRTRYAQQYTPSTINSLKSEPIVHDWNRIDHYLAGNRDEIKLYRAKYVILPMQYSFDEHKTSGTMRSRYQLNDFNLEEKTIEGIRNFVAQLTRETYKTVEENRKLKEKDKFNRFKLKQELIREPYFYTESLADFISEKSIFDKLQETKDPIVKIQKKFTKQISLVQLAQELQSVNGVNLINRTWHFKVHANCFIASELVNWMIENIEDISTREEAVALGKQYMAKKLFAHVEKRNEFLDGNYFYQLRPEFEIKNLRKKSTSSAATLLSSSTNPNNTSPVFTMPPPTPRTNYWAEPDTPNSNIEHKAEYAELSKSVVIDMDPEGTKSYRQELLTVHYDRVHNPDHCFHLRIEWLNATSKLIDNKISSWARRCEMNNLRLVEIPWNELYEITNKNPFHSFVDVKLALNPWEDEEFNESSCGTIFSRNKFYYHGYLLNKSGFLLDNQPASITSKDQKRFNIKYSWGVPSYVYSQYVHFSGAYIAEIMDEGNLFLAPNNTHIARVNLDRKRITIFNLYSDRATGPHLPSSQESDDFDSQQIMLDFRDVCHDEEKLREIFREAKM
ncbi:GTPase-activating protein IML1 ASCRUDRAFT_49092, partial [Ascoidea rubescens DSM 1968]